MAKKPEDAAKKPDEAAKKPEETKPAPKPAPKKIKKVQAFIGSQSAEELMKSLAKLSAMRSLGKAEGKKLEGFGLKKGDRGLVLEFKGSKKELNLGDNTYGNMDRYVQDKADGRVYVVEPRYLGDFPYAEFRLKDTGLTRVERVEIEKVQVAAKDKKKVLVQRHNNTPQKAFWSDEAAPDKSRLLYGNWVDKLTRLSVAEYLPPDEAPKGLTEVLAVAYRGKGDTLDEVRLYRGPPAMPAADKGKPRAVTADAYAKSRHTRALVKINGTLLEEILRDLDSILK